MPSGSTLAVFALASFLLIIVPGPAVLYVVTRSIAQGRRAGIVSMLGVETGGLVHVAAAAIGLSALVASSAAAFTVVKFAGAAYLIFLGIQMWRAPVTYLGAPDLPRETMSRLAHFRGGLLVGISNPKLLVFAAAFFPQFIVADARWLPQFALLVATFLAIEACAYVTVAASARGLARYLVQALWQRRLNRLSGAIFAGFGCVLLRYRP